MESSSAETPPGPVDGWRLTDVELLHALGEIETARRRLDARYLRMVAEAESRGLARSLEYGSLPSLLQAVLGTSRSAGNRAVKRAQAIRSTAHNAAAALAEGTISVEHLDVISAFHSSLSEAVHPDAWAESEPVLVELCKSCDPATVRRFADTELRLRIDPDGTLPNEKDLAEPRNEFSYRFRPNGWMEFRGLLEPESGTLWAAQLNPGSKPTTSPDGGPDPRSVTERQGEALSEWVGTGHAGLSMSTEGGERPQLTVTIGWESLRSGLGHATLGPDMLPIPVSEARRLACDCTIIPMVLGSESVPIEIGRASRNVPPHIRRLVVNRDRGCAFPGCARPASKCEVHHVQEWQHGGVTQPENLALVCRRTIGWCTTRNGKYGWRTAVRSSCHRPTWTSMPLS